MKNLKREERVEGKLHKSSLQNDFVFTASCRSRSVKVLPGLNLAIYIQNVDGTRIFEVLEISIKLYNKNHFILRLW